MCSHRGTSAGKYLFAHTQPGLQIVQPGARTQNDGPQKLAQELPEQDNQPRIFDGRERVRNVSDLCRCSVVMSGRGGHPPPFLNPPALREAFFRATSAPRDRPSIVPVTRHGISSQSQDHHSAGLAPRRLRLRHVPTDLPQPSCFSVRLESRSSVPACNLPERRSPRRSREARSRAEPRAAALCGEHGEHGEHWTLMAAATDATLGQAGCVRTSASASRNRYSVSGSASGKSSKSVTPTPSISVILLTLRVWSSGQRRSAA